MCEGTLTCMYMYWVCVCVCACGANVPNDGRHKANKLRDQKTYHNLNRNTEYHSTYWSEPFSRHETPTQHNGWIGMNEKKNWVSAIVEVSTQQQRRINKQQKSLINIFNIEPVLMICSKIRRTRAVTYKHLKKIMYIYGIVAKVIRLSDALIPLIHSLCH